MRKAHSLRGLIGAALSTLALSGCFTAHNGEVTSEYARQVSTASLRVAQLEQKLVESEGRILQLEEVIRLQGQSEAARLENLDQVNDEIARLRGAIEVLQFQSEETSTGVEEQQLSQEKRQLYDEVRLRQLEKLLGVKPPPAPEVEGAPPGDETATAPAGADGTKPATPEEPIAELPTDAAGRLQVAVEHMEGGRNGVARAILKRTLQENAGAPVLDEVRYRYAETFFNEKKWRESILEFQKVPDNHADSDWACWAYYRQGEAMEALQGLQQAAPFYKGATGGSCKKSEAAELARKKL